MPASTRSAARDLSDNPVFRVLARSGFAVNGLLHILIGWIAIRVALPGGGGEADQSGALRQVAATPGGLFVLWGAVVGLFALALFQFVTVRLIADADSKKRWGRRVVEAAKGLVYLAIGIPTLVFALGGSTSGSDSSQGLSARLLATPGGVFLLVAVGLAVGGAGVGFVAIGLRRGFRKIVVVPPGQPGRVVVALGVVGYIAEGIALLAVGLLFVIAAVRSDAATASGLDGALKALAELPYGVVVLVAVGAGFIAYGVFLIARARLAKL